MENGVAFFRASFNPNRIFELSGYDKIWLVVMRGPWSAPATPKANIVDLLKQASIPYHWQILFLTHVFRTLNERILDRRQSCVIENIDVATTWLEDLILKATANLSYRHVNLTCLSYLFTLSNSPYKPNLFNFYSFLFLPTFRKKTYNLIIWFPVFSSLYYRCTYYRNRTKLQSVKRGYYLVYSFEDTVIDALIP